MTRGLRLHWPVLFLVAYVALIALLLFAVPAHASTDPVKDTRQILAGTVTTKATKNAYLSGARDGTTAFQGALAAYKAVRAAEVPAPPPATKWVAAPLTSGGYARCKTIGGCHSIGVPYPPVIAQPGDVLLQKWNGVTAADDRQILALYPIGQWMVAGAGFEAYQDEWEGVAPAP